MQVLELSLLHQYSSNVKTSLEVLLAVLDKEYMKRNTSLLVRPPNSGKFFFFYCVSQFMINCGYASNSNRFQNFPFQECVKNRLIVQIEPQCETSAFEDVKKLFAGDPCNVKIKYKMDTIVLRTPFIVLSKNDIFPDDKAFRSRICKSAWKHSDFLKYCLKKPHPLSFPYLLMRHGLLDSSQYCSTQL